MLKSFLISILQKLFPSPYLLMNRIVDVLKLFRELGTLEINDAVETIFGKKPGLGKIYVALHHLERGYIIESCWIKQPDSMPRKYYRLTKAIIQMSAEQN